MKYRYVIIWIGVLISAALGQPRSLTVAWSANAEEDLLGYRLHWGTSSRSYTEHMDIGQVTQFVLHDLDPERTYYIALTAVDHWGNESGYSTEVAAFPAGGSGSLPWSYALKSAFPNPLKTGGVTTLRFALPQAREELSLAIYNTLGQRVRTLYQGAAAAGYYEKSWDGRDDMGQLVAAGVYYARLQTGIKRLLEAVTVVR